jgi:hypothetical protein
MDASRSVTLTMTRPLARYVFAALLWIAYATCSSGADIDVTDINAKLAAIDQIAAKDQQAAPNDPHLKKAAGRLKVLRHFIDQMAFAEAIQMSTWVGLQDRSDMMQKALADLTVSLIKAHEIQETNTAQDLQKVLDDATQAVKTSTASNELDAVLSEINTALHSYSLGVYDSLRLQNLGGGVFCFYYIGLKF